ncbi:cilia- and flagella-associated protein 157-like isoform X2 [Solea solea]|uniref:cilia- and flagella-associated protein 157-like isoform X2 n=1 Tax=Solea solea TaxID=90069 RepID=UPI00272C2A4C|nr:cilia- and flagella-associated protein 157-like isoform X2 [Solea solea]
MPKKKEKKSSDNRDEEKKTTQRSAAQTSGSDDREKTLYLTQIRYLNEQLERYQQKCDDLERQKKDCDSQYSALETEKKDIVTYLKRSVFEKEEETEQLLERLESQRQAAEKDREDLKLQHEHLRQELQNRIEDLNQENRSLVTRLTSLEEFQSQKNQLMSNMESLEKKLNSEMEDHKANIHSLELKALMQKNRLEKEMESHVAAMEVEMQQQVDQKVPEMSRLALRENAEVRVQFIQLTEQAQVLMMENSGLQGRVSQLSADVGNLEQMLSKLSRKSCVRKKVVEQLTEKCQQLQVELKDFREEHQQLQTEHQQILDEMKTLRHECSSLSAQCSRNTGEVTRLEADLQEVRRARSRLRSIIQEAAVALRQALMGAPTDLNSAAEASVMQWKQLMQTVMMVLSSSTTEKVTELQEECDPAAARAASLGPALSVQFQLARHRPGDLGFIPPPALKHILPKTGRGPMMHLCRKPSSQKTSGFRCQSTTKSSQQTHGSSMTTLGKPFNC